MGQNAMVIDYKFCTGCHSCEITCRKEHDLSLDEWGIKLSEEGPIQIDEDKWMWNYVPIPSDLCDLCKVRTAEGKPAACELHCLANCIEVIPVEEVASSLKSHGNGCAVFLPGDQGFN